MESSTSKKRGFGKWIFLGVVVLILLWQISCYSALVSDEENITVSHKKMFTSVDTMVKQIQGQGMVVENLRETILEVITAYTGSEGRKPGGFINAVAEAIPEVPASVWDNIAATMNAAYKSFETAQNDKQTRIGEYKKKLRFPSYLLVKKIGGFPTIDLEDLGTLVIGETAREAQETKTVETVDPFKK